MSAENPDITYSISVQTEVRNCHLLNCNDDIAYAYDVDNPLENDYHLYFQIEILIVTESICVGQVLSPTPTCRESRRPVHCRMAQGWGV